LWESQKERDHWDNIRMDLTEIGWDGVDWIDMIGTSRGLL
jgi:hypothetical protein